MGANAVEWATADFVTNPNANALRWQTLYNYRFTANTPPVAGNAVITMYRAGREATANVSTLVPDEIPGPACAADLTGPGGNPDGLVDVNDLVLLLAGFGTNAPGADLAPPTSTVNVHDLFFLLAAFGACK